MSLFEVGEFPRDQPLGEWHIWLAVFKNIHFLDIDDVSLDDLVWGFNGKIDYWFDFLSKSWWKNPNLSNLLLNSLYHSKRKNFDLLKKNKEASCLN